ncbi:MAG: cobalamin biosynthesis protein CobD [Chloroflexi bacterium]|nr:cobalamin biosynthesis protein CobD [Chloroflexota bacterium]
MSSRAFVPVLAFLIDGVLGDPPNRWHPVAWQGRLLAWAERWGPAGDGARFLYGAMVVAFGAGLSAGTAGGIRRLSRHLPMAIGVLMEAAALKLAIAARGLDRAAAQVETSLRQGDLEEARRLLGWHLVSRPTDDLCAEEVAAAAVESVAENLTDGLIAPLCVWTAGGLPAVWAYRFVQTADSMWGYHDPAHEWLGKPAARLDDVLNWLPARLAVGLLLVAAMFLGEDARGAWRARRSEAGRTVSPNAGQTMATMAGALGVTLTKRGHYSLRGGEAPITPETLRRARRLVAVAGALGVAFCVAWRLLVDRTRRSDCGGR